MFPLRLFLISPVETVEQTRRARLRLLVEQHNGLANLCETLGYSRKETSGLSRILNGNLRHDRDGEPYNMGSPMARGIESKLGKTIGWMDTPLNFFEIHENTHISNVVRAMETLPDDWQREKVANIVATLLEAQPPTAAEPKESDRPASNIGIDQRLDILNKKGKAPPRQVAGKEPKHGT